VHVNRPFACADFSSVGQVRPTRSLADLLMTPWSLMNAPKLSRFPAGFLCFLESALFWLATINNFHQQSR
jgi:hypothetical protein